MTVVDSSVWIDELRDIDSEPVRKLRTVARSRRLVVGDLVLLEVLQGARDESQAAAIEARMRRFDVRPLLDDARAVRAAQNYRRLRARGITVRSVVDLVVGTFCIDHGFELLQQDRDFLPMAEHLGLRLA